MALHMDIGQNVPQDEMYEKFQIDRPGKITFIGHHLSAKDTMRCLVRTISLYGAELDVSADLEMPVNFYLEILGIRDEIGCTLIRREEESDDRLQHADRCRISAPCPPAELRDQRLSGNRASAR